MDSRARIQSGILESECGCLSAGDPAQAKKPSGLKPGRTMDLCAYEYCRCGIVTERLYFTFPSRMGALLAGQQFEMHGCGSSLAALIGTWSRLQIKNKRKKIHRFCQSLWSGHVEHSNVTGLALPSGSYRRTAGVK